jgi:type I restriction enzyme R subunit
MSAVGLVERATQNRVIALFKQMGWTYLGDWHEREGNSNIEDSYLRPFLAETMGYDERVIDKALFELKRAAGDQSRTLYETNKEVYKILRYGVKAAARQGENKQTVWLIDWEHPERNHFAVAEEVTVQGEHVKRPDIVLYVNGIALGVLELKRSTVSVGEGIRQNLDSQKPMFIERFFATVQLVMAGNNTEGMRYGVIGTTEKYVLAWKEPSETENLLDRHLEQVCNKSRFLEIIHDFIVFDKGDKKTCRHNQYFGIRSAQEFIRRREGGIIWHTQGSGKSLSMVWLAKWIKENVTNSRVLIVTDRTELDDQIEKVFLGVDEHIYRTKSGADLITCLNSPEHWLLGSLIHKFGGKEDGDVKGYVADIRKSLPKDFKAKGDIYVFVDECHRSQSGDLHKAMKAILPDATFIGFTGTPLLKKDKQTSMETFGTYIHTYKFDEAVRDKVVLDLRYEARDIDQNISAQDKIDTWFESKTFGLNDVAKAQLKERWGTMRKVLSSRDRLDKIVDDILMDMETKGRLKSGAGNALLISDSVYNACRLYELFEPTPLQGKVAIVTSYRAGIADAKGEDSGEGYTESLLKYDTYKKMLAGKDVDVFEAETKERFINEPAQMKLLIVVDKLLTGFDAPSATYLYIDKKMRDHGLFQAICRVNRLDGEDKDYGYIVDYKDLFRSLEGAVADYTSEAFDAYDKEDVVGLLTDRLADGVQNLEEALESCRALIEDVPLPQDENAFIRYFCPSDATTEDELLDYERRRVTLYKLTAALIRCYSNIASDLPAAGYTESKIVDTRTEVDRFEKIRTVVRLASGDAIDLKMYEPAMRHLIDSYIRAEDSKKVSAFDNLSLVELLVRDGIGAVDELPDAIANIETAVAETIENNVRKTIIDEQPSNPKYYDRMSELLDALILQRKQEAIDYRSYLSKIVELSRQVLNPATSKYYPPTMNSAAKRALFDNLDKNEDLAISLDEVIRKTKKADWRGNRPKEREIIRVIRQTIGDDTQVDAVFDLVKEQNDY